MNTINLISILQNTKKDTWFANFQSNNGIEISNVKISSEKAKDFIINALHTVLPVLDENNNNIVIYKF
jgi:hypothetical protein